MANEFKIKMLKYSTGASSSLQPNEQPTDQTDTDAFTDADSDTEHGEAQQSEKLDEISIDDLPSKMSLWGLLRWLSMGGRRLMTSPRLNAAA